MQKTCLNCKKSFETKRKDKKTCSNACKLKLFRNGGPVDETFRAGGQEGRVEAFRPNETDRGQNVSQSEPFQIIPVVLGPGPVRVKSIFMDEQQIYSEPCALCVEREQALREYRERIAELEAELAMFKSEPTSRADAHRRSALCQLPEGEWEPI